MKKRFSKAVLICLVGVLLISSFELFSQCRQKISREELQNKIISNSKSFPYLENVSLPIPFNASTEPSRPFYKNIALQNNKNEAIPQPESLCDNGYYWMGGPTWTADTDGNALVWGAGGNLYFADANDPTHPIEMWWGDIPLRVRIHNGIALFFCYFSTYAFDVSAPLSPAWLSYGPGYSNGFLDAYSSPDDSYWILTDWAFYGGLTIWDPSTLNYRWGPLPNPQGGSYFDLFIDDQKNVVIAGDYSFGLLDFYDISNLACSSPILIGQISDNNAGLVYYDYPYLYSSYEPWQYYNQWIYGGSEEGYCAVSVIFLPDTLNPDNNFFIKEYTANYDVVSMKNSPNGFIVGYLQNRAVEWAPQFDYLINGCFINNKASSLTYDCAYQGSTGVAACSAGGARFFNSFFTETSHFITGEYAYDVVPWGDYLFVPSGKAGVAIIDNSDPSWPRTLSFLEIDTSVIPEIKFIAVSQNGERLYLSDGTDKVWFANISNKTNPFIISYSYYWSTLSSGNVSKLITYGNRLLIASESGEIDLLDISNPNLMIQLSSINYGESVVDIEVFELASYPGTSFLAVTTNANFYIFDFSSNFFSEVGFLENFGNYFIAISGNVAYLKNSTFIQPVLIEGSYPSFSLTIDGTTPLNIGYSWGPPDFIKKYDDTKLVCAGDDTNYGGYPSVFLIDIGTDPLAPQLLPYEQPGVLPFDMLSGLSVKDGLIYYATDYFGTGALTIEPDYDMPFATSSLVVTPQNPDIPWYPPNPNYWLTGNANLSITVRDNTSAITKVRFKYNNRTIRTLTNQTPAGQDGVYSFIWDTTLWTGSVNPARIVIEITDSGCNTATYLSDYTYAINKPPTFNVIWESGCNTPPVGAGCFSNSEWIVCGYLNFTVNAHAYFYNEVPNSTSPNDDITQIAYKIDDGSWVLYPVFPPYDGAYQNYNQYISIDTTSLSDGFHTLYLRVTDDLGLQTLKDNNGMDSWTFNVFNFGPNPQITSPPSGDVYRTSSITVTTHMNNEVSIYPTQQVDFYLDSDPFNPLPNGTLIGSSTVKSPNNNFSISWDASSTPLGSHTITCWAYYYGCCSDYTRSEEISINLVHPNPPPEIAVGNSYSEALVFSEDKQTILWPIEATASGYNLYRGTLNDLPNLQNENVDSCTRYYGANTTVDLSSDDPSAAAGNLYWYLVVGYNAAGDGPAGNSRIVNSNESCL